MSFCRAYSFFEPQPALRKLESGNEWCGSPKGLAKFRKFIEKSAAYQAVSDLKPDEVELDFSAC